MREFIRLGFKIERRKEDELVAVGFKEVLEGYTFLSIRKPEDRTTYKHYITQYFDREEDYNKYLDTIRVDKWELEDRGTTNYNYF